jgi:exonuclease SbcC
MEKREEEKEKLTNIAQALEKNQAEKKGNIAIVKKEIENIETKEKRLEEVNDGLEKIDKSIQVFTLLAEEIFHEKGFSLTLLKRYLNLVEEKTRNFLKKFLPEWNVKILTTEDKVMIKISDGKTERDLVTYSGGESVLIGFAIRLGIAKVLSEERIATSPKLLIIDEGFGPLSHEFREIVLKTFNELATYYEKIIVISHITEVIESPYFADRIKVYKDENGRSFFIHLQ